jgi:wyosine [tRNA(Phe)-imidazoG37] synthetase (radical SAM superfamily)
MQKKYRYLYGPVPSRRFGRSLGVDLTPYKTCSLDCVFCQLGHTVRKTVTREEYVPTHAVLAELEEWLIMDGTADYITLSGSGEPTLHSRFGEVLKFIRANTAIPTVLLTNGTMLYDYEVREAACCANIVKVSLSAWDQASFAWVNRPHAHLDFDQVIEGQKAFCTQFKGQIWMEVFLIGGINSMPKNVRKIAALAKDIAPDRIQLNTAVRPPSEDFVTALSKDQLLALTHFFEPTAEIIAEFSRIYSKPVRANQETVLAMLQRRSCSSEQIAQVFGMHLNEVLKYLGELMRTNRVRTEHRNSTMYYVAISNDENAGAISADR